MKTSFFKEDLPVGGAAQKSANTQNWISDSCLVSFSSKEASNSKPIKTDIHYFG